MTTMAVEYCKCECDDVLVLVASAAHVGWWLACYFKIGPNIDNIDTSPQSSNLQHLSHL